MKESTAKALDGLGKWNIRNYINHHFNEYLSKGFVIACIITFFIDWRISRMTDLSVIEGYRGMAQFLGGWNLIGIPAALIIFYYARRWLHESFDIVPPPNHLYKAMTYPIHVTLQLVGAVIILTIMYFLTSLSVTHTVGYGRVFIFVSIAMYLYLLDFLMYSVQTAIYLKDTQSHE